MTTGRPLATLSPSSSLFSHGLTASPPYSSRSSCFWHRRHRLESRVTSIQTSKIPIVNFFSDPKIDHFAVRPRRQVLHNSVPPLLCLLLTTDHDVSVLTVVVYLAHPAIPSYSKQMVKIQGISNIFGENARCRSLALPPLHHPPPLPLIVVSYRRLHSSFALTPSGKEKV